jgi:AcrR family transcriptional regulator
MKGPNPSARAALMDQEILDVATALFAKNGYTGTSTQDIGDQVGLDKTSLYYYFRSKEEILFQVLVRLRERGQLRMHAIEALDAPPDERLAATIRSHGTEIRDHHDEAKVYLVESRHVTGEHRREVARFYRAYERQIEQLIIEGQAAGLFDPTFDPFVVTRGLLAMLNGLFTTRPGVDARYIDQSVETYVRLVLSGLRPPAGSTNRSSTKRAQGRRPTARGAG